MNKFIGILTSAILTTNAMATSKNYDMTGLYVGGNIGYGSGTNTMSDVDEDVSDGIITLKSGMEGLLGGVHLGFQKMFNNFVAGVEGSASLNKSSGTAVTTKNDAGFFRLSIKRKNSFGFAGRFGPVINNWLIYGKFGYENSKFTICGLTDPTDSEDGPISHRLNAFVPGIGFETLLTQNIMLGAEWTYSINKNKKFDDIKIKARIGDFKVRLSYKF
jgi:opacity protein-like surface antigen